MTTSAHVVPARSLGGSVSLRRWQVLSPAQRAAVLALRVSEQQVEFAGTVERSVEACRAEDDDDVAGLAILDAEDVAGFLVLKRGARAPAWATARAATVSAMRIDASRQGRGLGAAALGALPGWVAEHWPTSTALTLSVDEENVSARGAYERAGFVDHGHREAGRIGWVLEEQRDVIEYPIVDDLDINGWDLRKALRLFWKSNPGFVEWIQSPLVYRSSGEFLARSRALLPDVYSIERGVHHYRSMARTNFRGYLQGELVPLKKYFYVLRPLLAVRWLLAHRQPAPIEFARLLDMADDEPGLRGAIDELLARKRASPEMGLAPQVPAIQAFITREIERQAAVPVPREDRGEVASRLSMLFRDVLASAWDSP